MKRTFALRPEVDNAWGGKGRLGALYSLHFDAALAVGLEGLLRGAGVGDEHVDF